MLALLTESILFIKSILYHIIAYLFKVPISKNYLIIGASSGIGKQICIEIAKKQLNNRLVIASRKKNELLVLKTVLLSINKALTVDVVQFDLTDLDSSNDLISTCFTNNSIDTIDTIVVNAGVFDLHHLKDTNYFQKSLHMFMTNTYGPVAIISNYLNNSSIKQCNRPYIVVVSSIAAQYPFYNSVSYSTSKIVVEDYIKEIAPAYPHVDFSIIRPGYVYTKLTEWTKSIPFGIEANQAARDILLSMKIRRSFSIIPFFPWCIAMPLVRFIPTFLMNFVIKQEFELNLKNNEDGIASLRKHVYNKAI